jgi:hypothetical protein
MTPVSKSLRKARALVEKGWTKGWFARNAKGRMVTAKPTGHAAVCFCAVGALIRVTGHDEYTIDEQPEFKALSDAIGSSWIDDWNDDQESVEPVLEAFDRAILIALKDEDNG